MSRLISRRKKKRRGKSRQLIVDDYQKNLAEQILIAARRIAGLEVKILAEQVILDATTIARWEKNPFYIV